MTSFLIEMLPDEKFSKATLRVVIRADEYDPKAVSKFYNKLNIALCRKLLLSEKNEDSETKFFFETDPVQKLIKLYIQNDKDLLDILKEFPKQTIFRPYHLDDTNRGAAGPSTFTNRLEVYECGKSLLEVTKDGFVPKETKGLELNIKFNSLGHTFNKIHFSYEHFPYRISFQKNVNDNREFFTRLGRIAAVGEYLEEQYVLAKNIIENIDKPTDKIKDCIIGRVTGDNIEIAATSFEQIAKFLDIRTELKDACVFRNVNFFHENKLVHPEQLLELAEHYKAELIDQFEGRNITRQPKVFSR